MNKIINPKTNKEQLINKVLGDEMTLAQTQDNAEYYDIG